MAKKFIFKNPSIGEVHIDAMDVSLPDSIREKLPGHRCPANFSFNGFVITSGNEDDLSRPCFFEWQNIKFVFVPSESLQGGEYTLLLNNSIVLKSEVYGGRTQIVGNVQLNNSVGLTAFDIRNKYNEKIFSLQTEVFPQKLDYKEDFKIMIDEITEILYSLVFDFLKKTFGIVSPREPMRSTLLEWLSILEALFDSIEKSVELILRNPHSKIEITKHIRQVNRIRKADHSTMKWLSKNQQFISKDQKLGLELSENLYVTHLQERRKRISYDTSENRFIKWAINSIILKLEDVKLYVKHSNNLIEDKVFAINRLERYRQRIIRYLRNHIFHHVEGIVNQMDFSTVLTMAPGYKDFYFRFLLLRRGLSISDNDIFKLDYKDISTLYEYWCFLKTFKILNSESFQYELESNDIIKLEHNRFVIQLKKGSESEVKFKKVETEEELSLLYNRGFQTPTYQQVPDNFIEFRKGDDYVNPFKYIMDAKYRFTRGEQNYPENTIKHGPPLDTIAQLHRYRDSILAKSNGDQTYAQAIKSLGGVILFPFPNDEDEFKGHRFFKSLKEVNIGAIPLRPGSPNKLYADFLMELLGSSPESLYENMINYDKRDYERVKEMHRIPVLIGLIPGDHQEKRMRYCLENNKYYIREARNPTVDPSRIRYVALFLKDDDRISYYGRVTHCEYYTVQELQETGAYWVQHERGYRVFEVDEFIPCNIPYKEMSRQGRRYTDFYSFREALKGNVELSL